MNHGDLLLILVSIVATTFVAFLVGHYCGWQSRGRLEEEVRAKEKQLAKAERRLVDLRGAGKDNYG